MRHRRTFSSGWQEKKRVKKTIGEWPDCPYCGAPFHFATGQVDHIQALSAGGTKSESNKILVCADCNKSKQNYRLEHWLRTQLISPERVYFNLKEHGKRIPSSMLQYLGYPE